MFRKQHPLALLSLIMLMGFPLASVGDQSADAKYAEGKRAFKADKYDQAMQILKPLAESGHAASQYYVGRMHEKGLGVPKDQTKALAWYKPAADAGNSRAQYKVGAAYAHGAGGLEKNETEAGKWFMKAAEQGSRKAAKAVAKGYKKGIYGLPKDKKKAKFWSEKAEK
ncbi:MAG: sel1 repeat family protein [Gammaproteobacteria bacterium]|nr:sel1 repeat family protein [Gammaproteobacteria bacterium]